MRVHILGGSGFLGSRIVRRLVERGDDVSGTARSKVAAERLKALGAEPIIGDLSTDEDIARTIAASGADTLVTSVSLGLGYGPRIVAAAEEHGLRRAVFVSTTSIFTKLDSQWKPFRLEAERAIRESALAWTIVRPTMIYGAPDDGNMIRLLNLVRRVRIVPLPGGGRGLQQPVHVDDLAGAIVAALDEPAAIGKEYNLAGPDALTLRDVIDHAARATGRRVSMVGVPLRPVAFAARIGERLGRAPLSAEQIERLAEDKAFDISDAVRDLGFAPRSFADGIWEEARSSD
jgi:nucleoside-diphosphate-sugar epimerase